MPANDAGKGSDDNRCSSFIKRGENMDRIFGKKDYSDFHKDKTKKEVKEDG